MKIYQSRSFDGKGKKLDKKEKTELDKEIKNNILNPSIGFEEKGDLRGVFAHEFKIRTTLHLLSYRLFEDGLELIMIDAHENHYRGLKS